MLNQQDQPLRSAEQGKREQIVRKSATSCHQEPVDQNSEAFCLAVVAGHNQSAAYRKAYNPRRATAKTINEMACRLMKNPKIAARVAELVQPAIADAQMKRREWVERLTRLARFDPRRMFDDQGRPKQIVELGGAEALETFERIEQYDDDGGIRRAGYRVRYIDRVQAYALLGKALGYYADQCGAATLRDETNAPRVMVNIVPTPISPEEAYRRMRHGGAEGGFN
jgi:phage terminase small subunit